MGLRDTTAHGYREAFNLGVQFSTRSAALRWDRARSFARGIKAEENSNRCAEREMRSQSELIDISVGQFAYTERTFERADATDDPNHAAHRAQASPLRSGIA